MKKSKDIELEEIVNDAFLLHNSNDENVNLAFVTLGIALKAYFSTYKICRGNLFTLGSSIDFKTDVYKKYASIQSFIDGEPLIKNKLDVTDEFKTIIEKLEIEIENNIDMNINIKFQNMYESRSKQFFNQYHNIINKLSSTEINNNDRKSLIQELKPIVKQIFELYKEVTQFNLEMVQDFLKEYCEIYTECILHFHHFAELICKNILERINPWYVYEIDRNKITKDAIIKHKIITNTLTLKDHKEFRTFEFSTILEILMELIDNPVSKEDKNYKDLSFMLNHKTMLEELTKLRNSIWHRGTFILSYENLDKLVGKYILPFVSDITQSESYKLYEYEKQWKYKGLACKLDPITEIIYHFKNDEFYDIRKVALLKEMGRSAYENPLFDLHDEKDDFLREVLEDFDKHRREEYEGKTTALNTFISGKLLHENDDLKRLKCDICNTNCLLILIKLVYYLTEDDPEEIEIARAKCECCSFEIVGTEIDNPSRYGIKGMNNYWE